MALTGAVDVTAVTSRDELKLALAQVRAEAKLTIREVAEKSGVPYGTVGGYFSGRHLPTAAQGDQFARILAVCGVDSDDTRAWLDAVLRVRRTLGRPAAGLTPYRGLAAFQAEDAAWFFGREELSRRVFGRIAESDSCRPLMVVGASGSGKSSLLRAGVAAQVAQSADPDKWNCLWLTPTEISPKDLLEHVTPPPGSTTILVVDQFEELFTSSSDRAEQARFIAELSKLPCRVVIGLRADFYGRAVRFPQLAEALERDQVVVGPMTQDELRRAIIEPARRGRVDIDPGLVELLIHELCPAAPGSSAAHDDGALPLLAHALLATWREGTTKQMTVAEYRATGGIAGAVTKTAEAVHAGLTPAQQRAARQLFLRLVHIGKDTADTRRRVQRQDILIGDAAEDIAIALDCYVSQRLLTADADTVEISHEALLSAWPRLRDWVDADRDGIRLRAELSESAATWHQLNRSPDALYRGVRLAAAREVACRPDWQELSTPVGRDFLAASEHHEAADQMAALRQARRMRRFAQALGALLLVCALVAGVALVQRRAAVREQQVAQSRQLANQARDVSAAWPEVAEQLAVTAYRTAPTTEALGALASTAAYRPTHLVFKDHHAGVHTVRFSPDGNLVASAGEDREILVRDPLDTAAPITLTHHEAAVRTLAFQPGSGLLASAGDDARIVLWDLQRRAATRVVPLGGRVNAIDFSADGRLMASGEHNGTVVVWDAATWSELFRVSHDLGTVHDLTFNPAGDVLAVAATSGTLVHHLSRGASDIYQDHNASVLSVALSSTGMMATGGKDSQVVLRDLARPGPPKQLRRHFSAIRGVDFTPGGEFLLSASDDGSVRWWSTPTGGFLTALVTRGVAYHTADLSPDGSRLATGGAENISVWPMARPAFTGHANPPVAARFTPDGTRIATAGPDGLIAIWRRDGTLLRTWNPPDPVTGLGFRRDGSLITADTAGAVRVWNIGTGEQTETAAKHGNAISGFAIKPDGMGGALGSRDGNIQLWGRTTPRTALRAHTGAVDTVAFDPSGTTLASGGADGKVVLWTVDDLSPTPVVHSGHSIRALTFTPDGRTLVIGDISGTISVFDVASRALLRTLPAQRGAIRDLTVDRDSTKLAAAGSDNTVTIWDLTSGTNLATLTGHTGPVNVVDFAPDDPDVLVSTGADPRVVTWDLNPDRVVSRICASRPCDG